MLLQTRFKIPGFISLAAAFFAALIAAAPARAAVLAGDLDGDGAVDASDEQILGGCFGGSAGEPFFEPAADLNADGQVDVSDLALFGVNFQKTGGDVDTTPPGLLISLNDIPDVMNDLLVAPPDGFQITLHFDNGGHSVIDQSALVVTSSEDIGPYPAGSDLTALFSVTPTRAVWEISAGSDLARTSHYLTASIRDVAQNEASGSYGFAVRDFAFRPPLGELQTIFLDFDQDRSLGPEVDLVEDLREYGLSSATAPVMETEMRSLIVSEIVRRAQTYYTRDDAGVVDAVNIVFVADAPASPRSRLCVGGESSQGALYLGAASLDLNNVTRSVDECSLGAQFGIFPQAIDDLWAGNPDMEAAFGSVDPDLGGIPFGEHPLDAALGDPDFNLFSATAAELVRFLAVIHAVDAFAQVVASAVAHETGHMLGLTAPGPAPGGLWGGTTGSSSTHNVSVSGGTPSPNYLMNRGGSFSFGAMTGRGGYPLPTFRPLNWAYLRDRIALNNQVQALYPAPTLDSADPTTVSFPRGTQAVSVTFRGTGFVTQPTIELVTAGDPTPNEVLNPVVIDEQTVTGIVNKFFVPPAVYDVHFINGDGQDVTLAAGLVVQ